MLDVPGYQLWDEERDESIKKNNRLNWFSSIIKKQIVFCCILQDIQRVFEINY